jgi:hypothetical protein
MHLTPTGSGEESLGGKISLIGSKWYPIPNRFPSWLVENRDSLLTILEPSEGRDYTMGD